VIRDGWVTDSGLSEFSYKRRVLFR